MAFFDLFTAANYYRAMIRLRCVYSMLMLTLQEGNFHWNLNFVSGKLPTLNSAYAYICRNLSMIVYII